MKLEGLEQKNFAIVSVPITFAKIDEKAKRTNLHRDKLRFRMIHSTPKVKELRSLFELTHGKETGSVRSKNNPKRLSTPLGSGTLCEVWWLILSFVILNSANWSNSLITFSLFFFPLLSMSFESFEEKQTNCIMRSKKEIRCL